MHYWNGIWKCSSHHLTTQVIIIAILCMLCITNWTVDTLCRLWALLDNDLDRYWYLDSELIRMSPCATSPYHYNIQLRCKSKDKLFIIRHTARESYHDIVNQNVYADDAAAAVAAVTVTAKIRLRPVCSEWALNWHCQSSSDWPTVQSCVNRFLSHFVVMSFCS